MFIKKTQLKKEPYAGRIEQLREYCEENRHASIPKLLKQVSESGIREDVLSYFETHKDMHIDREMYTAFLTFLTAGEDAGEEWYELVRLIDMDKKGTARKQFFKELTQAFQDGVPYKDASQITGCESVSEFKSMFEESREDAAPMESEQAETLTLSEEHKESAQNTDELNEMKEKLYELKSDADYYKKLYQELHFELDRTSMALMQSQKENRKLQQELAEAHLRLEKAESEEIPDDMPGREEHGDDEWQAGEKPDESEQVNMAAEQSHAMPEDILSEADIPEDAISPGDIRTYEPAPEIPEILEDDVSPFFYSDADIEELDGHFDNGLDERQLRDTVAGSGLLDEDMDFLHMPVRIKNPIVIFTEAVQAVKRKRYLKKKASEQRRELVSLMNKNHCDAQRQNFILAVLKEENPPMDALYDLLYQNSPLEQIKQQI